MNTTRLQTYFHVLNMRTVYRCPMLFLLSLGYSEHMPFKFAIYRRCPQLVSHKTRLYPSTNVSDLRLHFILSEPCTIQDSISSPSLMHNLMICTVHTIKALLSTENAIFATISNNTLPRLKQPCRVFLCTPSSLQQILSNVACKEE
jgi:hypothetical protein